MTGHSSAQQSLVGDFAVSVMRPPAAPGAGSLVKSYLACFALARLKRLHTF